MGAIPPPRCPARRACHDMASGARRRARLPAKRDANRKREAEGGSPQMRSSRPERVPRHAARAALVLLLLGVLTMMSACGGDIPLQKQASQERAALDHLLQHAQVIGVPASLLQPGIASSGLDRSQHTTIPCSGAERHSAFASLAQPAALPGPPGTAIRAAV